MSAHVFCALACDGCGVLDVKALPADQPVREVLARLACKRCGSGGLKLTRADREVARRRRHLEHCRAWQRRNADRLREQRRTYEQRPERKARVRERQRSPKMLAYFAEYYARPEVKARRAEQGRARREARKTNGGSAR